MATPVPLVGGVLLFLTFVASIISMIIVASDKLDLDIFDEYLEVPEKWTICYGPEWAPWDQVDAFGAPVGVTHQVAELLCEEGNLDCTFMVADSAAFDRAIVDNVPSDLLTSGFCDAMGSWGARHGWGALGGVFTDINKEESAWFYALNTTMLALAADVSVWNGLTFGGISGWHGSCDCLGRNDINNDCTNFATVDELFAAIVDGTIDATFYNAATNLDITEPLESAGLRYLDGAAYMTYNAGVPVTCSLSGLGFLAPKTNMDLVDALDEALESLLAKNGAVITDICEAEGIDHCVSGTA